MLRYVAPDAVTKAQLALVNVSLRQAVSFDKLRLGDVMDKLLASTALMFEYPKGIIVLEKRIGADNSARLSIIAIAGSHFGLYIRKIITELKMIAAEWSCDQIETLCYDPRLVEAIVKTGSRIESYNLVLEVE